MKVNVIRISILLLFLMLCICSCIEDTVNTPDSPHIAGKVFLPDSTTQSGILVRFIQGGESTFTNSMGEYRFENSQSNTCTIVASLDGYIWKSEVIMAESNVHSEVPGIYLDELPCTPKSELPQDYPLGIFFYIEHFMEHKHETRIGDSLWISAYEFFQPPLIAGSEFPCMYSATDDIWIISSLGDSEIKEVDEMRGGIPEIWSFGYIIDSVGSEVPYPNNGIVEVEPSGGQVIALYKSYWLQLYVCCSHQMIME